MATRSNGLFRRVDRPSPDVAKGGCYVYGTAGPGVDTGVLIDFEGTLYLGLAAVKELAETAGFSLNEEGEELERTNAFLQHEVEVLTAALADANDQLDALSIVMSRAKAKH